MDYKNAPKVFFKTFGCRTNVFDTEIMRTHLKHFMITEEEGLADIIIVNSCTVTNGADSGVRNYVRRVHAQGKKIYLSGCGVHTQGESLYDQGLVHSVFSHTFKEDIDALLQRQDRFFKDDAYDGVDHTLVSEFVGKSRAFIKIQEGCDFACNYCIIPSVRGMARSQSQEKILKQIALLAQSGFSEFVLTGTNMGSYGKGRWDQTVSLSMLIKKIADIRGVKRIRLGSLEPSQIDEEFKELLKESFMARHLHIALQHTDNAMLEIMNRRNRFESDHELFCEIAEKGYALGSDYIIGHPGESEERFESGLNNLSKMPITHIHPFIYSKRDGTASATMSDHVKGDVAKKRLSQIKSLVDEKNYTFRQKIYSEQIPLKVLIEGKEKDCMNGLDQFYHRIHLMPHEYEDRMGEWLVIKDYRVERENNCAEI